VATLEIRREGAEVFIQRGEKLESTAQEAGMAGVEEKRLHVGRQPKATVLVPVQKLIGVRGSTPDGHVTRRQIAALGERILQDPALARV
jgi:hypothetical protein